MSSMVNSIQSKRKFSKYTKAKKQVEAIKEFYNHLTSYLLVNTGLFLIRSNILDFFEKNGENTLKLLDWLHWNIIATPLIWGVGLLFHGLYVFKFKSIPLNDIKPKILKDWEEKQIQKYMEED